MRSKTSTAALLMFGSGFCALVYQIGWLREFRLIFGASTAASAAVLAIFIGGLGAGSLLLGPRADRQERPLRFYSNLEAAIAVCAALSPLLLALVRVLYIATGGSATLGPVVATIGRLALSALVLAVPTLAMGGTLPAVARAVTRAGDARRQDVAVLYAINTLGAVVGCVVSTFWMLETFGTRRTIWLAAAINLLVAMVARSVERQWTRDGGASAGGAAADASAPRDGSGSRAFVIAASGTVGFAFFLLELIWYRLLGPLLGGSVFTFGLVLAVALAGIGLGGLAYALVSDERPATLAGFATSCLVEAAAIALGYALGDRLAALALILLPIRAMGFAGAIAGWTIVTGIVVLLPAVVAGYQFPLLIALFGRGRERVGAHVGVAYAANTAGAILGSLAGGFGLLPWLTAPVAWKFVALVLVVLGAAAIALATPRRLRDVWPAAAAGAAAVALLFSTGPTAFWRHSGIGAGRAPATAVSTVNGLEAFEQWVRRSVVWSADGVESSVALMHEASGYAFIVNGKSDGSARADAGTQVMLGLLGAMRHPKPTRALVIGLGTGSTAGWLAAVPSIERVDAVELESVVLDVARACDAVNHGAMSNPKLRVTIGDAREALLTGREQYDVIASEPSNPFRAGIASLFTREYYQAARSRLSDQGVFAQWVQAYEIDTRTLQTIYATLQSVFPYVETWQTNRGDLVLLATTHGGVYSKAGLAARIAEEPFKSALADTWRVVDVTGVLAHFVANDRFAAAVARASAADLNTDDRNLVEFGAARSVGGTASLVAEVRRAARLANMWRPPLDSENGISWDVADTAWANFNGWDAATRAAIGPATPIEQARRTALERFFAGADNAGTRDLWRQQTDPPRNPTELALAADLEADAGSPEAPALIERLRAVQPTEADIVLAVLRAREGRLDEATSALEQAFARMRTDPWPLQGLKEKALNVASAVGLQRPELARRLYDALDQRFAIDALEELRVTTQVDLAARSDFAALCRRPTGALDRHPVWTDAFLRLRRDCYAATGDPRLARAARDLQTYLEREPRPIVLR